MEKGPPTTILASKTRVGSITYEQIPCSTEQGIFLPEQGILSREQGILRLGRSHSLGETRTGRFGGLNCAMRRSHNVVECTNKIQSNHRPAVERQTQILAGMPMTEYEDILLGGYCYALRTAGPFTIGEDFEAPRPAAGILPQIKIDRGTTDKLWSFVGNRTDINADESSEADIFNDATKRAEFESGVIDAMRWYVSDCQFQAELPTFRKQLKELRKAIERFQSTIPDHDSPMGHFLHMTYTGEVFLRDQRKPSRREMAALQEH